MCTSLQIIEWYASNTCRRPRNDSALENSEHACESLGICARHCGINRLDRIHRASLAGRETQNTGCHLWSRTSPCTCAVPAGDVEMEWRGCGNHNGLGHHRSG